MVQLTIVIKPFRAEAVIQALADLDIHSIVVREVKGYSRQKNYLNRYLGSEYSMAFLPKVEITLCVSEEQLDAVTDLVARTARTGRMGDGKIFVLPLQGEVIEF
jgi:nitrogen regulatory protein P-II 2